MNSVEIGNEVHLPDGETVIVTRLTGRWFEWRSVYRKDATGTCPYHLLPEPIPLCEHQNDEPLLSRMLRLIQRTKPCSLLQILTYHNLLAAEILRKYVHYSYVSPDRI